MYVYMYTYVFICIHVYIHMYVYVYVYIYIYVGTKMAPTYAIFTLAYLEENLHEIIG